MIYDQILMNYGKIHTMAKSKRISFHIPDQLWIDLKITCVLANSTMSNLVRIAIKDKIKEVKQKK